MLPFTITGTIQTFCDTCVLNQPNYVTAFSLKGSDGSTISSSIPPQINISTPGPTNILQATPTGIYTLARPSSGGNFELCSDASNCLYIGNYFHSPPQPYPVFEITWIEGGNTSTFDYRTQFTLPAANDFVGPVVQIATLADIRDCFGNGCVTIPASAVPEPSTWAMMALGFAGIGFVAYRRKLTKPALMAA
jgi:PEP-CTERM motif